MRSPFILLVVFAAIAMTAEAGCMASGSRSSMSGRSGTGGSRTAGPGGSGGQTGGTGVDAAIDTTTATPGPFDEQVLAIAAQYTAWGRVDDELRWAPFLCREPLPGIARPSASDDATTHGRKLYSVFAKNHAAYPSGPHDGQVVVKESWIPEEVPAPDGGFKPTAPVDAGDHFYPYARGDGGVFRAAAPAGLFIMFKTDAPPADTDLGWVYATVSPTGQVTSAGRVASCMGCHEVAEHERLFGVPLSPGRP
jgi:hypothetical protein